MALASLFSVELEFLAMADQANCTFVGVASSGWYICGRGIPVLHSSSPLHRSIPPLHSTEFIFPHHGHQADNFLHLGPMIHQLATDDIRPTQLLAARCDDRDHGCQISSRHATPLQGIHHPIMTFRLRTRITLKHQTNQISTITLIREWSSVQSISVQSSPVQSNPVQSPESRFYSNPLSVPNKLVSLIVTNSIVRNFESY